MYTIISIPNRLSLSLPGNVLQKSHNANGEFHQRSSSVVPNRNMHMPAWHKTEPPTSSTAVAFYCKSNNKNFTARSVQVQRHDATLNCTNEYRAQSTESLSVGIIICSQKCFTLSNGAMVRSQSHKLINANGLK